MNSSLSLGIILSFVGVIVFILISKTDLGVTSLKNEKELEPTLLGKIAGNFPSSDFSDGEKKEVLCRLWTASEILSRIYDGSTKCRRCYFY